MNDENAWWQSIGSSQQPGLSSRPKGYDRAVTRRAHQDHWQILDPGETESLVLPPMVRNRLFRGLSHEEIAEVETYVQLFQSEGFASHWQVNDWISAHGQWDSFTHIRSINDHVVAKGLCGIQPKFYRIVCVMLGLAVEDGSPLLEAKKY